VKAIRNEAFGESAFRVSLRPKNNKLRGVLSKGIAWAEVVDSSDFGFLEFTCARLKEGVHNTAEIVADLQICGRFE